MRDKVAILVCLLIGVVVNMPAAADEIKTSNNSFVQSPAGMFLVGEGIIGVNAWLASLDPQVYGGVGALLFPIAAMDTGNKSPALGWVGLISSEALAAYNIAKLSKNDNSRSEIFRKNEIAWHAFAAIMLTTGWVLDVSSKQKTFLGVVPYSDGGQFEIRWNF